jgi:hypothetical protein
MEKNSDEVRFEEVERLIRIEEEMALAEFRRSGFPGRVKARLEELPGRRDTSPIRRKIFSPVPVLVLTLVVLGAVAVTVFRASAPLMNARAYRAVLEVLEEAPAFQPASSVRPARTAATGSDFSWADPLARLLSRIDKQSSAAGPGSSPPPSGRTSAPLSRRERMRLLYGDKVIERALILISEKAKEV